MDLKYNKVFGQVNNLSQLFNQMIKCNVEFATQLESDKQSLKETRGSIITLNTAKMIQTNTETAKSMKLYPDKTP